MTKKAYLFGVLFAAVIVLLFALAFLQPISPHLPEPKEDASQRKSLPLLNSSIAAAGAPTTASQTDPSKEASHEIAPAAVSSSGDHSIDAKQETLKIIQDAMVTYSEEGLPVLKPYLSHPDPEIRSAAIDAVIQLAVPSGAEVLRQASKTAENSEEQIKMIQGADFLELPRIPLDLLKQVLEQRASAQENQPAQPAPLPLKATDR